ncbi:MAG: carboxypeptidase regulatory-like domain-containing protein [Planctomycetes bacterium]|nr:carboxypeptidase regulatory-like domain-containing protein [Planctomycetota bacterium]MCC7169089.1 carboxypeptidase regulatory-like domain-containing protein [Planctomycetota bacterium]
MIREERNALVLLLVFALGAFALYFFVLKPALESAATPTPSTATATDDDAIDDATDLRPKAAKRMFGLRMHVFDAIHGGPVEDANLTLLGAEDVGAEPVITRLPAGGITVDMLPPGITFGVKIQAAGYRSATLNRLRGEARRVQDLGVIALEPLRRLDVTLFGADDKPVADGKLSLFALDAPLPRSDGFERAARLAEALASSPSATATSGKDGAAVFGNLEPRRFALQIEVAAAATLLVPEIDLTRRGAYLHVPVAGGIQAGGTLARADASALGVDGSRLLLLEFPAPGAELLSVADVPVARDGSFSIPRILALPHVAIPRVGGAATMVSGPWNVGGDAPLHLRVEDGCVVEGTVQDSDQKPVEHAAVEIWCKRRGAPIGRMTTAKDGRYRIEGLPACAARLRVVAPTEGADERVVELRPGAPTSVAVRLAGSTVLEGVVQDPVGQPLPGALVETLWPARRELADLNGRFRISGLAPGDVVLRASWPGRRPFEQRYTVRLRETAFVECNLQQEHVLQVTVLSPEKVAEANVPIVAIPLMADGAADDSGARMVTSGDDGIARFGGLAAPARFVLLSAGGSGAPVKSQPFGLEQNGAITAVALTQRAAGSIEGVVRGDDGAPLAHALVRVHGSLDPWFERLVDHTVRPVLTSASGFYRVGGLPPGTYRVTAARAGRAPAAVSDLVLGERGALTGVDLSIAPAADLEGVVTDADGRPVAGAEVSLTGDSGAQLATTVLADGAGRFRFAPEPQEGVVVRARGPTRGNGRAEPAASGPTIVALTDP